MLLAQIGELILIDLGCFERIGLDAAQVFKVLLGELDILQARWREEVDLLETLASIVEGKLRNAVILARDLTPKPEGLNQRIPFEDVIIERLVKFGLFGRDGADDPVDINRDVRLCRAGRDTRLNLRRRHLKGREADEKKEGQGKA